MWFSLLWTGVIDVIKEFFSVKSAQSKLDNIQSATDKELNRELQANMPSDKKIVDYWSNHD